MNSEGHTAGQWGLDRVYVCSEVGATIADCGKSPTLTRKEQVANARLIAARMSYLKSIIERVEAASGPDRQLDCEIGVAVGWFKAVASRRGDSEPDYYDIRDPECTRIPGSGGSQLVPDFTASLDAVMALKQDGHTFAIGDCNEDGVPWACVTSTFGTDYAATGATVVLAGLSAILQARLAMEGSNG